MAACATHLLEPRRLLHARGHLRLKQLAHGERPAVLLPRLAHLVRVRVGVGVRVRVRVRVRARVRVVQP